MQNTRFRLSTHYQKTELANKQLSMKIRCFYGIKFIFDAVMKIQGENQNSKLTVGQSLVMLKTISNYTSFFLNDSTISIPIAKDG